MREKALRDNGFYPFLGFDLSSPTTLVVVHRSPLEGKGRLEQSGRRAERLFPIIVELLQHCGLSPREINSVGVGRGPGSFTGVRNAVMAAKMIAQVLNLPIYAPTTLEIMTYGVEEEGLIAPVLDARRGEVYYALYRRVGGESIPQIAPDVAPPQEAAGKIGSHVQPGEKLILIGTGAHCYSEIFSRLGEIKENPSPPPKALVKACETLCKRGESSSPLELVPLYLRRPDAEARF